MLSLASRQAAPAGDPNVMRVHSRTITPACSSRAPRRWCGWPAARQEPAQPQPAAPPAAPAPGRTAAGSHRRRARAPPQPIRSGINFVRVDVIVTDDKGEAGPRPEAGRVRGPRGRQAAEGRDVQRREDRRARADRRASDHGDPERLRRGARGGAQPNVRLFVILLDDYHVRRGNDMAVRKPLDRLHPEPARSGRTWWRSCIR